MDIVERYIEAWQQHDAAGIVETFAPGGTYSDPSTGGPLTGPAIGHYASGLWTAFPDLSFETCGVVAAGEGLVAFQWIMRGTNRGSMMGLPPTGRPVTLPGADFITVEAGQIRSVQGYFNSRTMVEQLGLNVVVQPKAVGPFTFGTSVAVQSGKRTQPGAFGMTALQVRSDEEVELVRNYSRAIAPEMLKMSGFISFLGVTVGHQMYTITAWERPEDPRQLLQGGTHKEAMNQFFGPNLFAGGSTSVWTPQRFNALWQRCPNCDRMVNYHRREGQCECGEALPEPPPYW